MVIYCFNLASENTSRRQSQVEFGVQTGRSTRYRCRKISMFNVPRPAN